MARANDAVSLGGSLRALRLAAAGSLDEMARATKISQQYLRALESDDFSELPAPVFVRGFIRAYCDFLGAPPDRALAMYQATLGLPAPTPRPVFTPRRAPWLAHPIAVSAILLVVFGAGLIALNLMVRNSVKPTPAPVAATVPSASAPAPPVPTASAPVVTAPSASAPAATTPEASAPVATVPGASAPVASPPASSGSAVTALTAPVPGTSTPQSTTDRPSRAPTLAPPVSEAEAAAQRLVVKAVEATWIRVQTDDGRVAEELLAPGATREWTSGKRFLLTVGNAGGVELQLNGRPLPSLGARGAVIRRLSLPESSAGS